MSWPRPPDTICFNVFIKQPARFERVGHRISGDPRRGDLPGCGLRDCPWGAGHPRSCGGPVERHEDCFAHARVYGCRRVIVDNVSACRAHGHPQAALAVGLMVMETRPCTLGPMAWTSGMSPARRRIHQEPARLDLRESQRQLDRAKRPVAACLWIDHGDRCLMAQGGRAPQRWLDRLQVGTNNLVESFSYAER